LGTSPCGTITKNYDCRNSAPFYDFTPFGLACYWTKPLPNSIKACIGPTSKSDPSANCYNLPTTPTLTTLYRVNSCDWLSGAIVWVTDAFGYPITLYITPWQKLYQDSQIINPIGSVFGISGCGNSINGNCTFDEASNQTTGTASCTMNLPAAGSVNSCFVNITVFWDENASPTC
jgi:hypothetical protein